MKQSYNIYKIEQLPEPKGQNYLFDENNNYIVDKNKLPVGKSGSFSTLTDEEVEAIHKFQGSHPIPTNPEYLAGFQVGETCFGLYYRDCTNKSTASKKQIVGETKTTPTKKSKKQTTEKMSKNLMKTKEELTTVPNDYGSLEVTFCCSQNWNSIHIQIGLKKYFGVGKIRLRTIKNKSSVLDYEVGDIESLLKMIPKLNAIRHVFVGRKAGELQVWIENLQFKAKHNPKTSGRTVRPYHPKVLSEIRLEKKAIAKARRIRAKPKIQSLPFIVGLFDADGYISASQEYDQKTLPGKPRLLTKIRWVQCDKNMLNSIKQTLEKAGEDFKIIKPGEKLKVKRAANKVMFGSVKRFLILSEIFKQYPPLRYKHLRIFGEPFHQYAQMRSDFYHKSGSVVLPFAEFSERFYSLLPKEFELDHPRALVCRIRQQLGVKLDREQDQKLPQLEELKPKHVEDFFIYKKVN